MKRIEGRTRRLRDAFSTNNVLHAARYEQTSYGVLRADELRRAASRRATACCEQTPTAGSGETGFLVGEALVGV